MPHWCYTDYTLIGANDDVEAAYAALRQLEQTTRIKNDDKDSFLFCPQWLGYVAENVLLLDRGVVGCRGTFLNVECTQWNGMAALVFNTETAWSPCEELMSQFAAKFRLSLDYYAEELGSIYFCKVNPDGVYQQTLYHSDDDGLEYYNTLGDFLRAKGDKYGLKSDATLPNVLAVVNALGTDWLEEIDDQT